ncbi:RHS repeat domain-containing protein, partial [Psychromonas sp. Urea-02u-13]|uniref:RHS repeat domain-containing protein n=1 Tax=Psychromonas sp. Urea-02u-13 TaxID=2058326 RepID=UPI000CB7180F
PLGRITGAQNNNRQLQWRYDAAGRVIEDHQDNHKLLHQYNAIGQRTASQLPNGETVQYQHDNNGAFTGLNYGDNQVASITRDSLGREIKRSLSNNVTTEHNYDPQGRLQRQTTYKAGTESNRPAISQRSYSYTQQGQLSQIDDLQRGTTQYHYDAVNRLTQVEGPNPESFVHDPAGNILAIDSSKKAPTSTASTPKHANQVQGNRLKFQGDTHYQYDAKGNRIAQVRGKGQKLKTAYRYNSLNQLVAVNNNGANTVYQYDALGRRISKQNQHERTDFLWFEDVLLSETTQTRNSVAQTSLQTKVYLFEPNTFKPLAFVQGEVLYHYHLDHLGTPQEITNANGEVVWAASFKAYGNLA